MQQGVVMLGCCEECGTTFAPPPASPPPHNQPAGLPAGPSLLPPPPRLQFLGDFVDRGAHSLETICLLLALKIEHPRSVHLIRGNHEAADINALFGFRLECLERLGDQQGLKAWQRLNTLFNWLPLAALIEDKVGGWGGGWVGGQRRVGCAGGWVGGLARRAVEAFGCRALAGLPQNSV